MSQHCARMLNEVEQQLKLFQASDEYYDLPEISGGPLHQRGSRRLQSSMMVCPERW